MYAESSVKIYEDVLEGTEDYSMLLDKCTGASQIADRPMYDNEMRTKAENLPLLLRKKSGESVWYGLIEAVQ